MASPRVFISHASQDIDVVTALAEALDARGIKVWLDAWQMGTGDNIVSHIDEGLDEATAGLIVFSAHARLSPWVKAETAYLAYANVQEGKIVIPVVLKDDDWVSPLLRPLIRRRIDDVDAIAAALHGRPAAPSPSARPAAPRNLERVTISLRRQGEAGVTVDVHLGNQLYGTASHDTLPRAVQVGQAEFRRGFRHGLTRDLASFDRATLDKNMAELGQALRDLCLPEDSADALASLVDGCPLGTTVEVCVEADTPDLLGLPFEALRLPPTDPFPGGRLLATQAPVVMLRRPIGLSAPQSEPLAGPLKILVAVCAPDEDQAGGPVLDLERNRHQALRRGDAPIEETQPEYATVSLFLAGEERPLADFTLSRQPLSFRPAGDQVGPVPQLRRGQRLCSPDWALRHAPAPGPPLVSRAGLPTGTPSRTNQLQQSRRHHDRPAPKLQTSIFTVRTQSLAPSPPSQP